MSRIALVDIETATPAQRAALEGVRAKVGAVPNAVRTMANAPAVVEAFFAMHGALAKGALTPALREQIALAVSNAQGCRYCVAHHGMVARHAGLDADGVQAALRGQAKEPRDAAALKLALRVATQRGQVDDAALAEARRAGLDDGALVEIVAAVAAATFGNYLNHLAETEIDLPRTELVPEALLPELRR